MEFFSDETYISWLDQLAENDYVIIDDFISEELFGSVSTYFSARLAEDDLAKAGIGALGTYTVDKQIRGDYVYWLDESKDTTLQPFFAQMNEFVSKLKRFCFLSISDVECHLAYYPIGSFYKRHVDQFKERNNRILSFVLYLNPNWKEEHEGELVIYKDEKTIKVAPIKSRLILFKSAGLEHEVALTHNERFSLTGWMLNNPVGIGFL
ncbi:MAG: 2OG-Fe(II) oxygenase [Crocinitomicaceae bacterium]